MRTKFYLNGKKITKKALQERIGEERLKRAGTGGEGNLSGRPSDPE